MADKIKKGRKEKAAKPIEKWIWFAASAVIAVVGFILRKGGTELPFAVKAVYCAMLLFAVIMAAQRTSEERFRFGAVDEKGKKADKKKYALSTLVYYLFIFAAVFYCFFCLWVVKFISV